MYVYCFFFSNKTMLFFFVGNCFFKSYVCAYIYICLCTYVYREQLTSDRSSCSLTFDYNWGQTGRIWTRMFYDFFPDFVCYCALEAEPPETCFVVLYVYVRDYTQSFEFMECVQTNFSNIDTKIDFVFKWSLFLPILHQSSHIHKFFALSD